MFRRRFLAAVVCSLPSFVPVLTASAQSKNSPVDEFRQLEEAFHKFHVSVTQIEYDQKEHSAEITLRVFADDLEIALSQHAKRPIKIDPATAKKDKKLGETVMAYLRERFQLKTSAGRPVKLGWVGMEWQADMFWLYVEGKLPNGLEGTELRNKVFQELFEDQVNIVNSKIDGKQIGLMFDAKDDFKLITALPAVKK